MRFKLLSSKFYILTSSSSRSGQSLVEILIGMAIGISLIMGGIGLIIPSMRINTQVTNVQRGAALAKELLDNVRVWSEGSWNNVLALSTGTANMYYLNALQSPFAAATGTELVANNPVTSGLAGWWKFDEGTGTVAFDSSGKNANGNWQGTLGSQWTTNSKVGAYAGNFNGSNNYVNVGNWGSFPAQGTISFWTNTAALASYPNALTTNYNGGNAGIRFEQSGGGFTAVIGNDGGTYNGFTYTSGMAINTWYHVVLTWDTSTNSVAGYWNGVRVFSASNSYWATTIPNFAIGEGFNTLRYWNGKIDDVRIYKRALSAIEINQLYTSQTFTRSFYVNDVYRDAGGNILATGGGTYDPSTKQITVAYGWAGNPTSTMSMYLTRNRDNIYAQTDWFGGPGATSAATSVGNQFAGSSNIDYTTTTGSIYINIPGY